MNEPNNPNNVPVNTAADRNFDDLAERFSTKIYGGLKGKIRLVVLWRDLEIVLEKLQKEANRPLRILDVAGGLSQLSIRLAGLGHEVTVNDISSVMLEKAKENARALNLEKKIEWICAPYQSLAESKLEHYDLVLCHALLEWLEKPENLVPTIAPLLRKGGYLSLCFYNPAGKVYRNLIRGNFKWVKNNDCYPSDEGSLTPNKASSIEQVRAWLAAAQFSVESETGLRVFHDYVIEKRGGNLSDSDIVETELLFSNQAPYKWLGRYLHVVARKD